jgi:hypothetical protein
MRGLLRYVSALAAIGLLFGSPAAYVAAGMRTAHAEQPAAQGAQGCHDSAEHLPAGHDPVHCLFFSCSSIVFLQMETAPLRIHDRAAAVAPQPVDDAPRAAVPERDPPIPRLPA